MRAVVLTSGPAPRTVVRLAYIARSLRGRGARRSEQGPELAQQSLDAVVAELGRGRVAAPRATPGAPSSSRARPAGASARTRRRRSSPGSSATRPARTSGRPRARALFGPSPAGRRDGRPAPGPRPRAGRGSSTPSCGGRAARAPGRRRARPRASPCGASRRRRATRPDRPRRSSQIGVYPPIW